MEGAWCVDAVVNMSRRSTEVPEATWTAQRAGLVEKWFRPGPPMSPRFEGRRVWAGRVWAGRMEIWWEQYRKTVEKTQNNRHMMWKELDVDGNSHPKSAAAAGVDVCSDRNMSTAWGSPHPSLTRKSPSFCRRHHRFNPNAPVRETLCNLLMRDVCSKSQIWQQGCS